MFEVKEVSYNLLSAIWCLNLFDWWKYRQSGNNNVLIEIPHVYTVSISNNHDGLLITTFKNPCSGYLTRTSHEHCNRQEMIYFKNFTSESIGNLVVSKTFFLWISLTSPSFFSSNAVFNFVRQTFFILSRQTFESASIVLGFKNIATWSEVHFQWAHLFPLHQHRC